jgi:CBS-domain-containing membrane protein
VAILEDITARDEELDMDLDDLRNMMDEALEDAYERGVRAALAAIAASREEAEAEEQLYLDGLDDAAGSITAATGVTVA